MRGCLSAVSLLHRPSRGRATLTLEPHIGIRVELGGCQLRVFNLVIVVIAVDFVALIVYERRVAVDNGSPHARVVDRLQSHCQSCAQRYGAAARFDAFYEV